jgi:hypothetical protein
MANRRTTVGAVGLLAAAVLAQGCGGAESQQASNGATRPAEGFQKHHAAAKGHKGGKVGDYPIGLTIYWERDLGQAELVYAGGNCTRDEWSGKMDANGTQHAAFIAKNSGSCGVESSTVRWNVHTNQGDATFRVEQAHYGSNGYVAFCEGKLDCKGSRTPSDHPPITVS